jgi:3-(3-hydroxy-phenyl)propionate hydroxylase
MGRAFQAGASETVRQKLIPNLVAGILALSPTGEPVPPAGTMLPQPMVEAADGSRQLLDEFVGWNFLLLTLGEAPQGWLTPSADELWRRLGGVRLVLEPTARAAAPHRVVAEQGSLLTGWMRSLGVEALLVRPDKYLFGAASDPAVLNQHIHAIGAHVLGTQPQVRRARENVTAAADNRAPA